MAATRTLEERTHDFKQRLKELYPDYLLEGGYINGDTYVFLRHKDGYLWRTKPRFLDGKRQCPEIALLNKPKEKKFRLSKTEWQEKLDNKFGKGIYLIQSDEVKTAKSKVKIFHSECKRVFEATLDNMINVSKRGCTLCYSKIAKTVEQVQEEVNKIDSSYTVLDVVTSNGHSYMKCRHNSDVCNNSEFDMRVSDFISVHAQRCPICMQILQDSKAVRNIEDWLNSNSIIFEREVKIGAKNINELPYDFYIPSLNLLIEYDGSQHFKASGYITEIQVMNTNKRDQIKTNFANENGYNLLRINYKQNEINVLSKTIQKLTIKGTLS